MSRTSNLADAPVEVFASPWATLFYELVGLADDELLIASPFISNQPIQKIINAVGSKQPSNRLYIGIVTNLSISNLLSGSLDLEALLELVKVIPNSTVTYLPNLHAKIYIADTKAAVVTSANLTNNGLTGNHEYGVLLQDPSLVQKVKTDLIKYAMLGNTVSLETLTALARAAQELKVIRQQAETSVRSQLKKALEKQTELAQLELLRTRARGKTTHGIFCDTILYLLDQKGSLKTVELHPLIQQIHPDLCDDSIDRVIDGVHFGKRWKHYVRNAQQALKRQERIKFNGQRWLLVH